jgi:Peptidase S46
MTRLAKFLPVLTLAACGPAPMPTPPPPATAAPLATADVAPPFENPGGMWAPEQLAAHADTLKKLGLEIDPAALTDPMAFPLGAVVYLGGCTASFVSSDGLIITNHHCAAGALQLNSTPEVNLLRDGFLAKTRADEPSNGPSARVRITQKFTDVTANVRAALGAESDDKRRYKLIEDRTKALIGECEKDRPEIRCDVVSYFGGEQFVLIEQLEIRDVRLAYAPAEGIGSFGGEKDNWRWPRHSGDYAFFRAYVGPDGKPADHSEDNVPFKPRHHLKVASKPLGAGDLVFVAGYPARTTRLRTAEEVTATVDWYYPRVVRLCDDYIALLDELGKDEDLAIKGGRLLRGLNNWRTNTKGMLDGLVKGGLKEQKANIERDLASWAKSQPDHAGAAQAITRIGAHYARYRADRDRDAAAEEVFRFSTLLSAADAIVRMAEERPKPDAERDPAFQARNHKRIEQGQQSKQRTYARKLDSELVMLALIRAARLPADKRPKVLGLVLGNRRPTDANIRAAVDALYAGTTLDKLETRLSLLRTATTGSLSKSKDPIIQLALKHRPILQAIDNGDEGYSGAMAIDRPKFAGALRAFRDGVLAPDANRTLRVTYGTVRGYRPSPDESLHEPFTKLSGMVAKHTGAHPFNAPAALVDAAKQGPYAPYRHAPLSEVPVNFLADLDITGGNSGSPTLNARGELVGLAFDGNYEAMASDWLFIPSITRSIHVDIRYVLWIMDRVDGADHLLEEMGITPTL